MMYFRNTRVMLSSVIVVFLLLSQAIAIAQACTDLEATPAMAFSADEMAGQNCHGSVPPNTSNPNACLQHCTAGDQTTAQAPAVIAGMPALAVLTVPMPAERAPVFAHLEACELLSPDPPPSIRFCSFQL